MGLFNYIDTFFFISLGITFVLILLLVFHFKQQITSLEQKNDTMFEIINNIVKELNFIKSGYLVNSSQYICQPLHEHNDDNIIIQQQPFQSKQIFENKIVISDDDSYNNIKDSDDDDSDSDDDSDDSDDDSDSDSIDCEDSDSDNEVVIVDDAETDDNKIKVINIELGDNIEINDIQIDNDNEPDNENENEEITIQDNFENDASIIVTKLENDNLENIMTNASGFKPTKDYYVRMNLNELKTLVVTKGLVSDASKMKKVQLIQLLLENP